ncbi:hypothetical protein AB0L74_10435 [Streptomyces sp. NPDC052020]|uniref:hypothetical protein n=1 Tax=Streptomyces sp. NPDC052020 TaxID=3155677 RepID=UPI003448C92D
MTVNERIQALVIKWLEVHEGIKAVSARIDEEDWAIKSEQYGYCDTCAYDEEYLELTIWYSTADEVGQRYVEVRKDPLSFLAELLHLEDETK